MKRYLIYFLACTLLINPRLYSQEAGSIRVLIFSGSNNHDWEQTTDQLERIFSEASIFSHEVTNLPDTLGSSDYELFDVIVSNWNSWPENDLRWPQRSEEALSDFIKKGGGFVTFHASSSAFYTWPEFKKFTTGAWVMDITGHGDISDTWVSIQNDEHVITSGMTGFFIRDELWVHAEENTSFETLGTATNYDLSASWTEDQAAIMVSDYGKGRIFHTILGHDARTMRNSGFRTLMLRGTEWAATGSVTQPIPQELQTMDESDKAFNWVETDTSFALQKGKHIIWKYNFNELHGKPFFHPVVVGGNRLTCISPDDHPWHLGQWFTWKFINGVNYWEYQNGTFQSEGVTEIRDIDFTRNPDFSAEINLDLVYHPIKGENVLAENRTIKISAPQENGDVSMEYILKYKALAELVDINRTPIAGEPGGQSWGGYAGLSIRFNQDFVNPQFISSRGETENVSGKPGDWLYMGFNGLDGTQLGSQIMVSPDSQREGAAWYTISTEDLPFYYFSPAYLYYKPLELKKGEQIELKYRIDHISGVTNQKKLEKAFKKYKREN
jgi:type 1 glutamine amidotransferase